MNVQPTWRQGTDHTALTQGLADFFSRQTTAVSKDMLREQHDKKEW